MCMSSIQVRGFLVDLEKIDWQLRAASDNMRSPCARGLLRAAHISFGPVLESAVAVRWKQPVGPPGLFQEGAMTKGTWPWALSPLVGGWSSINLLLDMSHLSIDRQNIEYWYNSHRESF